MKCFKALLNIGLIAAVAVFMNMASVDAEQIDKNADEIFQALDKDKDGKISKEEWDAVDTNKDGKITKDEWDRYKYKGSAGTKEWIDLNWHDRDADGFLDREDFITGRTAQ
jgi:Ca2+-binding EF-hand superfamily protein